MWDVYCGAMQDHNPETACDIQLAVPRCSLGESLCHTYTTVPDALNTGVLECQAVSWGKQITSGETTGSQRRGSQAYGIKQRRRTPPKAHTSARNAFRRDSDACSETPWLGMYTVMLAGETRLARWHEASRVAKNG